ncbi:hypothetical protein BOTBODRAFT_30133 [Botryobasidium botryosum FD-172 SS1]|uniref:Uncharacterized protein n=2 Tax=Botryobasidium botryosum (strain FD-172 SS1) TaxID=930990 RepID=A0A067N0Q0_BOTB1|nr:hypothetical protein BOTBODRAFT_30133 [Botryobasidium botryosum FD-172 SS1]
MSSSAFIFSPPADVFTVARPVEKARAGAVPCTPPRAPTSRVPPARPRVQRTVHYAHPGEGQALAALPCFSRASASAPAPSTPPRLTAVDPRPRPRAPPAPRKARAFYVSKEAAAMAAREAHAAQPPRPRFVH